MRHGLAQLGKLGLNRSVHAGYIPTHLGHITAKRLKRPVMPRNRLRDLRQQLVDGPEVDAIATRQCAKSCTISSVIFLASPNSIIVFGRKNNSLSTPA